eukprot:TRINITY_DN48899_c0_g1_i1.p1 TRINITY_DN48899_c0_g1~~TRINITY_DN48899_c0_g1_i1.p1  ORF type:complete len:397 (+),score=108.75 TRINITY_DN48899_c0_g1_i1:86-1192(+)
MDTWGRFLCLFALAAASASVVTEQTAEEKLLDEAFGFLKEKPKHLDPDAQQLWHKRKRTAKELAVQAETELADEEEVDAPKSPAMNPVKPLKRTQTAKELAARVKAELAVDEEVNMAPKKPAVKSVKNEPIHRVLLKRAETTKVVDSHAQAIQDAPVPQASKAQVSGPVEPLKQVAKPDHVAAETRPVRSAIPASQKQPVEGKVATHADAPVQLAKETEETKRKVESKKASEADEPPEKSDQEDGASEADEPDQEVEQPELPFSELQPFGRRNVGESLTESAISQSNAMVDQLERAEVAEEKRAVFRSLTRLRGVALSSFDGIARSQTGNIEEYAKHHHWRKNHPVKHLAEEESDVKAWAFPANADFF